MDNPGYFLRPDMFVDVELLVTLPAGLSVPAEAVLDSGVRKTVFVEVSEGVFEPRVVEIGWRYGDHVQILRGLVPGEQVVVNGNFYVDSESRLKAVALERTAAQATPGMGTAKDPFCGMSVDPKKAAAAGLTSEYRSFTYYFCSQGCKRNFDKEPERHLKKSTDAAQLSPASTLERGSHD